jgi:hypothetical protein
LYVPENHHLAECMILPWLDYAKSYDFGRRSPVTPGRAGGTLPVQVPVAESPKIKVPAGADAAAARRDVMIAQSLSAPGPAAGVATYRRLRGQSLARRRKYSAARLSDDSAGPGRTIAPPACARSGSDSVTVTVTAVAVTRGQ